MCPPQKQAKTQPKLLFFTIHLLFVTSNQIPTYRRPNLLLTSSIYWDFLPLEIQGRFKQAKVYHTFYYFVWKENPHKPLKVVAAKISFPHCICYWYNFLRWMFFILRVIKDITFRENLSLLWDFWSAMLLLSLKSVFYRKFMFYALSPQKRHDANTRVPK